MTHTDILSEEQWRNALRTYATGWRPPGSPRISTKTPIQALTDDRHALLSRIAELESLLEMKENPK